MSWSFRLQEEFEQSKHPTLFVTLTYANNSLPWTLDDSPIIKKHFGEDFNEPTTYIRHVQNWIKLVRRNNTFHCADQLRYYCAGEYGEKFGRPHYHIILFNCSYKTMLRLSTLWKHGSIDLQLCDGKGAIYSYVANYVVNSYSDRVRINKRPSAIMSKRPYLGHTYVTRMYNYHKRNQIAYLERGKFKMALPRIFKNKIFEKWELNAMKLPAFTESEKALEANLHRLRLLNGDDYDAFNDIERTRIHWEKQYRLNAKHNDNYQFKHGSLRTTKPISEILNSAFPINART